MSNAPYAMKLEDVALLLMVKRGKTAEGRKVHAIVLARVEIAMAIASELAR